MTTTKDRPKEGSDRVTSVEEYRRRFFPNEASHPVDDAAEEPFDFGVRLAQESMRIPSSA